MQEESGFPDKADKRAQPGTGWTPAELNRILQDHVVAGDLTTFGCVVWQSQLFRGVMHAHCHPFDTPTKRFHGFNPKVCDCICVYILVYTLIYIVGMRRTRQSLTCSRVLYSKHKDSGFPMGCADTASVDGRRGSNVYEVDPWLWQFGRGKPRLGDLSVEATEERMQAHRHESQKRGVETRWLRKAERK
jgi:hypothetical protein